MHERRKWLHGEHGRRVAAVLLWAVVLAPSCVGDGPDGGSDAATSDAVADDATGGADAAEGDASLRDAEAPDAGLEDGDSGRERVVVQTNQGPVRGVSSAGGEVAAFRGIPYAKPPTGSRRWRAPRPPYVRDSMFEADTFGPACPQPRSTASPASPGPTDEDCLSLNVWSPEIDSEAKKPVMVWLHGGGFIQGSARLSYPGGTHLYSGRRLAERGVVVVTLNYRLGPLGFLAHPDLIGEDSEYAAAGNYGFLDQVAALKWLQNNIERFGGDPERVTLFGESAGGISTCGHLVSEKSRGLFDRAIMQSGGCPLLLRWLQKKKRGMESAVAQGERIADKLGCKGQGIACLRGVSTTDIFSTLELTYQPFAEGEAFGPIVDGAVFEKPLWTSIEAGEGADVPVIAGVTADEGTLFASSYRGYTRKQYRNWVQMNFPSRSSGVLNEYPASDYAEPWRALAAILGDITVTCPTRWSLRTHVADGHAGWGYVFTRVTPYGRQNDLGAFHGSELTFLFGNFVRQSVPSEARELSDRMGSFWTSFARSGDPGKAWAEHSMQGDEWLALEAPPFTTRSDYREGHCAFWAQ